MKANNTIHLDAAFVAFCTFIQKRTPLLTLGWLMLFVGVSILCPDLALAQSSGTLSTNATTAVNYIKTGVYFILIVAVLGSAVAAAFGRMEWATVGRVLIGCVVAGLATEVVNGLSGLRS
jgi:hypothetical protein